MIYINDKFRLPSLLSNFIVPCGSIKIEGAMHAAEADQQNFDNLVSFTEKKGCSYVQPQKVEKSITMITSEFLDAKTVDHQLSLTQSKHHDFLLL